MVHPLNRQLLREPLLQFLLLGAALFGLFGLFGRKNEAEAPARILVSEARVATLSDGFARTWRRPPTEQELQGLVEDYVRDEVFYREGKAAGLDRDDPVIRRRVRQKMEFLAEDMTSAEPGEQLAAYLASHPERFRTQGRLTFHHVFLSATRRGTGVEEGSKEIAKALARDPAVGSSGALGDPFLLGQDFRSVSQSDVAQTFGETFAQDLYAVDKGRWQGPIPSGFGLHFVFVDERTPGNLPPLDAVRQTVQKEWLNERRREAEQALYRNLRDRYEVIVQALPARTARSDAKQ